MHSCSSTFLRCDPASVNFQSSPRRTPHQLTRHAQNEPRHLQRPRSTPRTCYSRVTAPRDAVRRLSWVDIGAPKFHLLRIHIHWIGYTMETRTKHRLKLAFWGGVGVVMLLSAIIAAFE